MVDRGCSDLHEGKNHGADLKKSQRNQDIFQLLVVNSKKIIDAVELIYRNMFIV